MSELAALATLVDAIDQVDGYVSGVLGLVDGRLGDDDAERGNWFQQRMRSAGRVLGFGESRVATIHATTYGPEQLRKASGAANGMLTAVSRLRRSNDERVFELLARLDRLALGHLVHELNEVSPASPELADIHHRLSEARAAALETSARLTLDR